MRPLRRPARRGVVAALLFATLVTGILPGSVARAQQAIKAGDILTGRLRLVHTSHPNGSRIDAYQIVSVPRTMPSGDEFCEDGKGVTTFHLFTMNDAERNSLKPWLGKTIAVKAAELFCAQTAWHIGDVAVPKWTIAK